MTHGSTGWASRLAAAWQVMTGSASASGVADQAGRSDHPEAPAADPRNRIAALELDLRERDAQLARVREEYERLRTQAERERAGAANAGFDALARRLAPLLSQLATMQALAEGERPLRAEDVLKLFAKVEHVLAEAGLARIGAVGEQVAFDTRVHQRMSGADVRDGDPVTLRFVGYRLGEAILLKAMVSRSGAAREAVDDAAAEDTR